VISLRTKPGLGAAGPDPRTGAPRPPRRARRVRRPRPGRAAGGTGLAGDPERLPAGSEDPQGRDRRQRAGPTSPAHPADDVPAVVQHGSPTSSACRPAASRTSTHSRSRPAAAPPTAAAGRGHSPGRRTRPAPAPATTPSVAACNRSAAGPSARRACSTSRVNPVHVHRLRIDIKQVTRAPGDDQGFRQPGRPERAQPRHRTLHRVGGLGWLLLPTGCRPGRRPTPPGPRPASTAPARPPHPPRPGAVDENLQWPEDAELHPHLPVTCASARFSPPPHPATRSSAPRQPPISPAPHRR
jgi:hypothetical protein